MTRDQGYSMSDIAEKEQYQHQIPATAAADARSVKSFQQAWLIRQSAEAQRSRDGETASFHSGRAAASPTSRHGFDPRASSPTRTVSWRSGSVRGGRAASPTSRHDFDPGTTSPARTASWKSGSAPTQDDPSWWVLGHHQANLVSSIERRKGVIEYLTDFKAALTREHGGSKDDVEAKGRADDPTLNAQSEEEFKEWQRPDKNRSFRINLAELQRFRLRKLQYKLVKHAKKIRDMSLGDPEPENWEQDLDTYSKTDTQSRPHPSISHMLILPLVKALQDYDYMKKCSQSSERDCFLVTGERKVDDYVLRSVFKDLQHKDLRTHIPVDGPWGESIQPVGGTRNEMIATTWMEEFRRRIVMAAVGGLFLIGPMWLMVLHNTLYTSLVSTTAFVTVFGLLLALYVDSPKDVLSGTAAYAAVLVVFVGLGSP
ncbi:hypothetical protein S40288_11760 [Stachybotrys chartarum IBT 40288]|nr:hypothetical protein S40288_11760 [Stachybotrys chartarum IBT 40288]